MKMIFASLFIALLFLTSRVFADCPTLAQIVAFDGQISIKPAGKVVKKSPGKLPAPLCAGDEVHSFQGKALIHSMNKDVMTLDAESVLTIKSAELAGVSKGKALFDIQKRQTGQGLQVATRLSVIGVKGTRFLVSDKPEGVSVALDEGVVDVKSTQGKLGLYREKEVEKKPELSFEDFKRQIQEGVAAEQKAFEEYKKEIQREFVAYVENITMQAGTELTIAGNEAVERKTSGELKNEMEQLRRWQSRR